MNVLSRTEDKKSRNNGIFFKGQIPKISVTLIQFRLQGDPISFT